MPNHAVTSERAGSRAVSAVRRLPRRKVSGASILAAAVPTTADARCVGCAVGAGERPADAPPGYVYYPAYGEPLPGPNCYWFRMPVYDTYGNMVGWRGRPVAFRSAPGYPAFVRGHCLDCASAAPLWSASWPVLQDGHLHHLHAPHAGRGHGE
jgi:hypothetical protein